MRVAGFVFAVLVAGLAVVATRTPKGCGSVYLYSTCAGLLCPVFIAVGGGMTVLGVGLKVPGSVVARWIDDCEAELGDSTGCAQEKMCAVLRDLRDKLLTLMLGAGVPLLVAGTRRPPLSRVTCPHLLVVDRLYLPHFGSCDANPLIRKFAPAFDLPLRPPSCLLTTC